MGAGQKHASLTAVLLYILIGLAVLGVLRWIFSSGSDPDQAWRSAAAARNGAPIPPELRSPAPRRDVFSGKGYLSQREYRAKYLPLLLHGRVFGAVCTSYVEHKDPEGVDVSYELSWLDENNKLRRVRGSESYDPVHAARGSGDGNICVPVDAQLSLGRRVTVVCAQRSPEYVVYEALCIPPSVAG